MSDWDRPAIEKLVLEALEPHLARARISADDITPETDLYGRGIIDSYDVVELLVAVEEKTGLEPKLKSESGEHTVFSFGSLCDAFLTASEAA